MPLFTSVFDSALLQRLFGLVLGCLVLCAPLRADDKVSPDSQGVQTSPWSLDFAGPRGVTLSYDGVPIIRQSSLFVVKPGWAGLLFDGRSQKYQIEQGSGTQPSLTATGENENFRADYRLEALDARRFRLHFRGELKRDVPASLEYAAGYFNANLLANRPFRAQTPQGERTGLIPSYPKSADQFANDVAPNFQSLEFDSRVGKLKVEARSASRVVFFDARRDAQEWAKSAPVFWCGWLAGMQPLRFGQPVELQLDLTLDALAPTPHDALDVRPTLREVAGAQSSHDRPIQIIPQPQKLQVSPGAPFVLSRRTGLTLTVPRGEKRLTAALRRILGQEWKLDNSVTEVEHAAPWARIVLGRVKAPQLKAVQQADWWHRNEGYRLSATPQGVEILAPTAQGAFYGLQTLAQLLRATPKGRNQSASCPALVVEDWPARAFRGAHWFPSASGVPFHKKLIADVLARFKFNTCVIQCEAARWDTDPLIAAPNSISKADLRALVQLCRDNFIEPIPLINVPGHAEWMFRNGRNLDLAEDPKTPYAYAVNNPKSRAFVKAILSEAIEVFQPKTFHLGHDEVTMRGRFPNPTNPFYQADKSTGDLVLDNLKHLHGWLATRGIKTMIWSDMLLASEEGVDAAEAPNVAEAKRRRALVPPDVIVADWHYGSNEKYPSLGLFRDSGLATVAATWQTPLNIRHFARAANGMALGTLQTTWAGYFPDESTLKNESRQFAAFVLAGDYAWSNRAELPAALPYDATSEWTRAYKPQGSEAGERSGALVDLTSAARTQAADWLGLGRGWDLALLSAPGSSRRAPIRCDDVLFDVPPGRLVVLGAAPSRSLAPATALAALKVSLGRKAHSVALLHTALWPTSAGTVVGRMKATYSDGTVENWDLTQGRNVASWQRDNGVAEARRGWVAPGSAKVQPDNDFTLRVARWENPHPEKVIASLNFVPVAPESGWAIAGLSLLD